MSRALSVALSTLVLASGCATAPADLDLSLQRPSDAGRFVVVLQPPEMPPAINQIHAWTVKVATPAGVPVTQARIAVDGGMPQHRHGLPTRPQVTTELGDGRYLMEGVKFSMTGWWQIKLAIQAAEGADRVTFNTVVRKPAVH
jgi:hypothetical protein